MNFLALLKIFDIVPGWAYAAFIALCLAHGVVVTLQRDSVKLELAQLTAKTATDRTERERVARVDAEQVAHAQFRHAEMQQEKSNEDAKRAVARAAADKRVADDTRGLRDIVHAYANGGGQEVGADPAACRRDQDRSARLGELVEEALDLSRESEGFIRQRDDEVRRQQEQIQTDRAALAAP